MEVRVLSSAPRLTSARRNGPFFCTAVLAFAFAWCATAAGAQTDPHAALPERPSVATHAFTIAPGWVELEFGATREDEDGEWLDTALPLNVKLGLASRAQLSLSFAPVRTADSRGFATDSVTAAIKWRLADDQPVVGTVALLPAIELPTTLGGQDTSGAAGLVFITSRSVHSVDLDLNLGYTRRVGRASDSWTSQTLWAASGSGPLLPTVTWGAEMFGYVEGYEEGPRAHPVGALASATVAVRPWFTIDVSGTVAVSGAVPRAVQVGAVWNVGRLWRAHARGAPAVGPTTWTRSERR